MILADLCAGQEQSVLSYVPLRGVITTFLNCLEFADVLSYVPLRGVMWQEGLPRRISSDVLSYVPLRGVMAKMNKSDWPGTRQNTPFS